MKNSPLNDRIRSVRAGIRSRQPIVFRIEAVRKKVAQRRSDSGLRSPERQFEDR